MPIGLPTVQLSHILDSILSDSLEDLIFHIVTCYDRIRNLPERTIPVLI